MPEFIEIDLQIVEPVYIGTNQVSPTKGEIELRTFNSVIQWKYIIESVWTDLFDTNNLNTLITFENLLVNGDIGTASNQIAAGDHDHEIGDMNVLFENNLI